jgi:NAD(P)-dependent dehydrogenase (short-subunit alcohol dehydrogenase family)
MLATHGPVLLADANPERAAASASALGSHVQALRCDVGDPAQVQSLVRHVGRLGSLVIAAGVSSTQPVSGETIMSVNLVGTARVIDAFESCATVGSVAVCIASMASYFVEPSTALAQALDDPLNQHLLDRVRAAGADLEDKRMAYALSKLGVRRLVRRSAKAWGARNARILSVSPGVVDTGMGREALAHLPGLAETIATWPIPRLGRPEAIASIVTFLCSTRASFMTGSDVLVDGGAVGLTPGPPSQIATGASEASAAGPHRRRR